MANIEEYTDSEISESSKKCSRRTHNEEAEAELEELVRGMLERNNGDAEAAATELGSKTPASRELGRTIILRWSMLRKHWRSQGWTRLPPLRCLRQALEESIK